MRTYALTFTAADHARADVRAPPLTTSWCSPAPGRESSPENVQFIQRAEISPEKPEGAIQHVALFKNVLVLADGRACTLSHSSYMFVLVPLSDVT